VTEKTHEIWNLRFLNQILNHMADGVFTMDPNGSISSWNPSMERISGYTAREALGKTCAILQCSRCFGKECPAGFKKCGILESKSSEAKECMLRHKDGYDVSVIKNASVVKDEKNKVIGVVETVTDLTELNKSRQLAEEALARLGDIQQMGHIIGKSATMQKIFNGIKAAAASDATILVNGQSGTGKELVASAIHYNSQRKDQPLVTVNCSALSENLLESELFGHVKGAYTGAIRDRAGRFEEAQGGTVFLDEIGELSPLIQVKLLRVIQEREIERVGESKKRKIDIRVITATHQDLFHRVKEGLFREDLYYRLKVFPINLPSLHERKEDIPLLVNHFTGVMNKKTGKNIKNLSQTAMQLFMDYDWPGNVRELENAIEHAFVLCNHDQIESNNLPIEIRRIETADPTPESPPKSLKKRNVQNSLSKDALVNLLEEHNWNKKDVGRELGVSHTSVWKYMKKWDIPLKRPS
jgi:two-component system, NtrC family, response regulator HydG